jgi:hypothetical protein
MNIKASAVLWVLLGFVLLFVFLLLETAFFEPTVLVEKCSRDRAFGKIGPAFPRQTS